MTVTNLKRLLAVMLALLMPLPAALAEAFEPAEAELPLEEAAVEELGEIALPAEEAAGESSELAVGALAENAAVESGTTPDSDGAEADFAIEADPDAMVLAPASASPVLSLASLTLGAKDRATLTLANGALPQNVGAVFTSSNPKIAAVDASGLVTAKKVGTATISLNVGGVQSSCAVTVRKAPKKVTLSAKKLTLGVGEAAALGVTLTKDSVSAMRFTSDNPGVASVDGSGRIVGTGIGTATITASTYNNKKAKCKVTVKAAPTYVTANVGSMSLWQGRTFEIEPILSPDSAGAVYCASSNSGVVAISGTTARAVGKGSATITLTTYNGRRAEIPVQVTKTPVYRALVIGEGAFPGSGMSDLPGKRDAALMSKMLAGVKGPAGSGWIVQTATDLTAEQIHSAIRSAFAGAQEGDVSLFYISTHGDQEYAINGRYSGYAGCLMAYPDTRYTQWYDRCGLTLGRLAGWLCEVPGQVVVMIDSCGSGAAIYGAAGVSAPVLSPEDFDGATARDHVIDVPAFSPEAFDQAVIDAFRELDKGVLAPGQGAFVLENKFFVLTSSAYRETGWALKNKYSFFTKWLTDSVKTKGKMPADTNRNKITTLGELYACMKKKADKKTFKYQGAKYKQHVQVYPANSGFELFFR
ncbi:MAG: Ig-like domain-containing protein [Clostridia bacterium]|nr:Ig-like domain-containing protein [Clostridia bacterium]